VNGTSDRQTYTATAGQTVFAATYDTGYVDVYLNGVKLLAGTDFTATNGTSITLTTGATLNDVVDIVAYGTFVLADHYTGAQSDARYVQVAGDTMTGGLTVPNVTITNEIRLEGDTGPNALIQKNASSGRDELQIYADGDAYQAGSRGAGIHLYGNSDSQHDGNFAVLTGPDDNGDGRIIASGREDKTHVTIGNAIFNYVDDGDDHALLNLKGADAQPALLIEGASSTEGDIVTVTGEAIQFGHWDKASTTFTERMQISDSGYVGIGGSPDFHLDVQSSVDTALRVKSNGTGDADAVLALDGGDTGESHVSFRTDGVEEAYLSMTGGAGGDLNLGTQTSRNIDMQPNATLSTRFVPSNGTTTTEIARFYANGTHCGGVSAISADMVIGQGSVGLLFEQTGDDRISPAIVATSPAVRDAQISLGGENERFKNLYLSGGAYLGGTTSSNKLEDYEEGTWTPTLPGLTSSVADGSYTKVGSMVTAQFRISSSSTTDSHIATLDGLPFVPTGNLESGRSAGFLTYNASGTSMTLLLASGTDTPQFRSDPSGSVITRTTVSGNLFWGTLVYKTSA
jgi:hypothetical protein